MNIQTKTGGTQNSIGDHINIGVVTVSDRASKGEYLDEGGPKLIEFFCHCILTMMTKYVTIHHNVYQLIDHLFLTLYN